ncbi:MAG: hypothetical protein DID92_2727743332 [Candidatus Nitrotoga sp. SPKER]|nr:MAG: hypothetical protein DID92_2727743332 [Candidatus Nitrotoga sp. SPKER]
MTKSIITIGAMVVALTIAFAQTAIGTDITMPAADIKAHATSTTNKNLIRSAMQAAPKKVSAAATIIIMNADGTMRTLREGTNGFTCMPDNPATPGPDPMCMDKTAMEWAGAWIAHKPPVSGKIGLMYMLAGGTNASNTDPYAKKPGVKNHWIKTGPHVMIVGADNSFYDMYPKHTDPDTSVPYVMWSGTPYQHLMIPIK